MVYGEAAAVSQEAECTAITGNAGSFYEPGLITLVEFWIYGEAHDAAREEKVGLVEA